LELFGGWRWLNNWCFRLRLRSLLYSAPGAISFTVAWIAMSESGLRKKGRNQKSNSWEGKWIFIHIRGSPFFFFFFFFCRDSLHSVLTLYSFGFNSRSQCWAFFHIRTSFLCRHPPPPLPDVWFNFNWNEAGRAE
jgi:hypothetical protein